MDGNYEEPSESRANWRPGLSC